MAAASQPLQPFSQTSDFMAYIENNTPPREESCAYCKKTAQEVALKTLFHCQNCATPYCNEKCQKQDWRSHKITCKENVDKSLMKELHEACLLPQMQCQIKVAEIARTLIERGHFNTAVKCIKERTSEACIRQQFFRQYANAMLKDPSLTNTVLREAGDILPVLNGREPLKEVVTALAVNNHIDTACALAKNKDIRECSDLLELVHAVLINDGNREKAEEVRLMIPDPGKREDLAHY